jgi:hypothetical protein
VLALCNDQSWKARETKLADFDRKEKALRIVSKQLLTLEDIVREIKESQDTTSGTEQLRRWKSMTIGFLTEAINEAKANELRNKKPGASDRTDFLYQGV